MWWMPGNPGSGRSEIGWLERIIARHPLRAAVICLVVAATLLIIDFFAGFSFLFFIGAFLMVISFLLLIYALVRKAMDVAEKRKSKGVHRYEELDKVNGISRQEAVARWRYRAQQKEMDEAIERAKRGR
jgi:predicted membrane protein